MSGWQPIESAEAAIRTLEMLIERSGSWDEYGTILVWSKKTDDFPEGVYRANLMYDRATHSGYWKSADRTDDNYQLKPTHYMLMPEPPK